MGPTANGEVLMQVMSVGQLLPIGQLLGLPYRVSLADIQNCCDCQMGKSPPSLAPVELPSTSSNAIHKHCSRNKQCPIGFFEYVYCRNRVLFAARSTVCKLAVQSQYSYVRRVSCYGDVNVVKFRAMSENTLQLPYESCPAEERVIMRERKKTKPPTKTDAGQSEVGNTAEHPMWCPSKRLMMQCNKEISANMPMQIQSSQIVSRSRSPRLSAPHTLHLFLESRLPKPKVRPRSGTSRLERRWSPPSSRSAAALSLAIRSASIASSSASGLSSMVSRDEIEGLRERIEVGVEGTDEDASEDG